MSPTPFLHEPHLKQHEEDGAPIVVDDEQNKKEKDFTNITDWSEHAHPELKPLLKNVKEVNFNSWLKVKLMSALMSIPIPIKQAGVGSKKFKGQGVYFYPTNDENDGEAPNDNCAAALWLHGGGRIMGSAGGMLDEVCHRIVVMFNIPVLSVQYRLAPRHPFPAPLDDCYDAYKWLGHHLTDSSSSPDIVPKIAVGGESAGGGLAAELCQRLLDESRDNSQTTNHLPACQLLIYPMLDDRTCINDTISNMPPHLLWNQTSNKYAWKSYLGKKHNPGDENIPMYAAASRRECLKELPPCYMLCGDLDIFYEECTEYARRLKDESVETDFHVVEGGFHACVSMGREEEPIVEVWERFQTFGKKHLFD